MISIKETKKKIETNQSDLLNPNKTINSTKEEKEKHEKNIKRNNCNSDANEMTMSPSSPIYPFFSDSSASATSTTTTRREDPVALQVNPLLNCKPKPFNGELYETVVLSSSSNSNDEDVYKDTSTAPTELKPPETQFAASRRTISMRREDSGILSLKPPSRHNCQVEVDHTVSSDSVNESCNVIANYSNKNEQPDTISTYQDGSQLSTRWQGNDLVSNQQHNDEDNTANNAIQHQTSPIRHNDSFLSLSPSVMEVITASTAQNTSFYNDVVRSIQQQQQQVDTIFSSTINASSLLPTFSQQTDNNNNDGEERATCPGIHHVNRRANGAIPIWGRQQLTNNNNQSHHQQQQQHRPIEAHLVTTHLVPTRQNLSQQEQPEICSNKSGLENRAEEEDSSNVADTSVVIGGEKNIWSNAKKKLSLIILTILLLVIIVAVVLVSIFILPSTKDTAPSDNSISSENGGANTSNNISNYTTSVTTAVPEVTNSVSTSVATQSASPVQIDYVTRREAIIEILVSHNVTTNVSLFEENTQQLSLLPTPQKLALDWIVFDDTMLSIINDDQSSISNTNNHDTQQLIQRYVLAVLYYSANKLERFVELFEVNWLDITIDECYWEYVICNNKVDHIIVDLEIFNELYDYEIPSELSYILS